MNTSTWVSVPQRARQCDLCPSTVWRHIRAGLLPPPVKLASNTTRFPAHELSAVDTARLRGASDDAVRALVRELVAARKTDSERVAA